MFRRGSKDSSSWFFSSNSLWKSKNPHSLEYLKYLHQVLSKNQTITESNKSLLVEALRSIAEILIWGDQNDPGVFDFFLEKNMLSYFLKIMRQQKCGSYVCVQLLQTLNILFENIRNQTSIYYLLSNNHVNSIIEHKFDFSDEEVMAYYISFLKTLSLKLNNQTIHFFYNEHTHDFPLYTEAIKFFNNSESMVRIAVRTLTLNVYRVEDKSMHDFIRDKTAAPYFSNLIWFIADHIAEIDRLIKEVCCSDEDSTSSSSKKQQLLVQSLLAEHLDLLTYLNDILLLKISDLNTVLVSNVLSGLIKPVVIESLKQSRIESVNSKTKISRVLALYLLTEMFSIIEDEELLGGIVEEVATLDLCGFMDCTETDYLGFFGVALGGRVLDYFKKRVVVNPQPQQGIVSTPTQQLEKEEMTEKSTDEGLVVPEKEEHEDVKLPETEEEPPNPPENQPLSSRLSSLQAFFYPRATPTTQYNSRLVNSTLLNHVLSPAVSSSTKVRIATVTLAINFFVELFKGTLRDPVSNDSDKRSPIVISDSDLALLESLREENISVLSLAYERDKSNNEMFLEMFEDEYTAVNDMNNERAIQGLLSDACMLLPPVSGELGSGVKELGKRRPCGETERIRRSMRLYFLLRKLSLFLRNEEEKYLPLSNVHRNCCVSLEQNLDLTNSDLLACTVIPQLPKEANSSPQKLRRFLVVDSFQLILVEPSQKRMGWGVVKFVGFLQDLEALGDPTGDPRCLHITIKSSPAIKVPKGRPVLVAKFVFDDHIRCMAARQRLVKGRHRAREKKLNIISRALLQDTGAPTQLHQQKYSPPQTLKSFPTGAVPRYIPIAKNLPGGVRVVTQSGASGGGPGPSTSGSSSSIIRGRSPNRRLKNKETNSEDGSVIPMETKTESSSQDNDTKGDPESNLVATTSFIRNDKGVFDV